MSGPRPHNAPPGAQRLFVACDLPEAATAAITDWQRQQLGGDGNLRPTQTVHLTLCFLGSTPDAEIPEITQALAALRFEPFRVTLGAPIFLPERGGKRVIALSLEPTPTDPSALDRLAALQSETSSRLARIGAYTPEKRPWLPHVTVARFRQPGQPFSLQNVNLEEICLSQVVLYTSVLARGGAEHTPLAVFPAQSGGLASSPTAQP